MLIEGDEALTSHYNAGAKPPSTSRRFTADPFDRKCGCLLTCRRPNQPTWGYVCVAPLPSASCAGRMHVASLRRPGLGRPRPHAGRALNSREPESLPELRRPATTKPFARSNRSSVRAEAALRWPVPGTPVSAAASSTQLLARATACPLGSRSRTPDGAPAATSSKSCKSSGPSGPLTLSLTSPFAPPFL